MKQIVLLLVLYFFGFNSLVMAQGHEEAAPSRLPHMKEEMLTAGFWITRHPSVDKIILTSSQINTFNDNVRDQLKLTKDIFTLVDQFQMESLMDALKKNVEDFSAHGYYTIKGVRNDGDFIDKARLNMYFNGMVLGKVPRYGVITQLADQRFLPTSEGLYAQKGDIDFDELQNSGLDIGVPVAMIHKSKDGRWAYVLSALSDGWVKLDHIALGDVNVVKNYSQPKNFVVVTAARADIFLDEIMTKFHDYTRMGVKFPLLDENDEQWVIQLPLKDSTGQLQLVKGYIPKSNARAGYLPYTARTIYEQSFLMLDKPYGWGDMRGQQDCSRFLQMIYATVGIELPRDSKNQAQVGQLVASFDEKTSTKEKSEYLQNALGAQTILAMKGHILLYLGMDEGMPFAIHATSGYSQAKQEMVTKYILNRVVVSDLSLGENSPKGSLLRRLTKIVEIK